MSRTTRLAFAISLLLLLVAGFVLTRTAAFNNPPTAHAASAGETPRIQLPPSTVTVYADLDPNKDQDPYASLTKATGWINSQPLSAKDLKGKVVLIDFWTFACANCRNTLPYIKAWDKKYRDKGLVIIGVHTPELETERDPANVNKAVHNYGIEYPIAIDANNTIWDAFNNQYWPALYFFDAKGVLQHEHFGEGDYQQSEKWIEKMLKENNQGS